MNYYEILEIDVNASQKEIRRAYKLLAKKYHPDMNADNKEALEKMKEINTAYDTLSDIKKRAVYDEIIKKDKNQEKEKKGSDSESGKNADKQKKEDYQEQTDNLWEEINKLYEASEADQMQEEEIRNRKHKFPFYFSLWFIWLICLLYLPYSMCVSFILTLGRYTELEKDNLTQRKVTNVTVILFLLMGMVYGILFLFLKQNGY